MKTSYSTIFNEGLDFSTVLLDRDGKLIAEKNYTPSMMGAISHTVTLDARGARRGVLPARRRRRPQRSLPRQLPHPRAHDDEADLPRRRAARRSPAASAIWPRSAARRPGSFAADATDVYQEGLRLPPVKLIEGGATTSSSGGSILANHRTPRNTWGDFHAMIGALNVGERRFWRAGRALRRRPPSREGARTLIDYSERRLRAEIAELPDGEYSADMLVEDDGVGDRPVRGQGRRSSFAATR